MVLLDPAARPVIAHRGDRAHAPENTLVAFERGLAAGADGIEFDLRLSADGEVVLCHDPTVDRTTDGSGEIARMSLAQLRELDAGARWSPDADPELANGGVACGPAATRPFANAGHRLPLLRDVLDSFPDTPMVIELKTASAGAAAADIVCAHGASGRVLFGSFVERALAAPRARGCATLASRREIARLIPRALLGLRARGTHSYAALSLSPTHRGIPLPVSRLVRSSGVPVHVWTVNDPRLAVRLWTAGVQGILSDNPGTILRARTTLSRPSP